MATAEFAGRIALITGAGAGMGRAAALAFAREGARVALADVNAPEGEETARLVADAGGQAFFVRTDVASAPAVTACIAATVAAYGRLHFAFHNAGVNEEHGPITDCTEAQWDRILAVNLKGIFLCMKAEIPEMLRVGGGAIVN